MDTLKLAHVIADQDWDSFEIELEARFGCPLLTISFEHHGRLSVKPICILPGDLERLGDVFRDWANRLREYQSQQLTNNLFEE